MTKNIFETIDAAKKTLDNPIYKCPRCGSQDITLASVWGITSYHCNNCRSSNV